MLGVWCAERGRGLHDEVVEDVAVRQWPVSAQTSEIDNTGTAYNYSSNAMHRLYYDECTFITSPNAHSLHQEIPDETIFFKRFVDQYRIRIFSRFSKQIVCS